MSRKLASLILLLAAAAFVAAGCGDDPAPTDTATTPTETGDDTDHTGEATGDDTDETGDTGDDTGESADVSEELEEMAQTASDAGCEVTEPEEQAPDHGDDPDYDDWSSDPPSSGEHFTLWGRWGFYEEPLQDGYAVHNLEHGGVVVWYGEDTDDETTEALADLVDTGEKWVITPREDFEGIASSAWGKQLTCDEDAVDELGADGVADLVEEWFDETESTGHEAEKDLEAMYVEIDPGTFDLPTPPEPTVESTVSEEGA